MAALQDLNKSVNESIKKMTSYLEDLRYKSESYPKIFEKVSQIVKTRAEE
jgi:hypothetical protein